jgi:hypothetical protein
MRKVPKFQKFIVVLMGKLIPVKIPPDKIVDLLRHLGHSEKSCAHKVHNCFIPHSLEVILGFRSVFEFNGVDAEHFDPRMALSKFLVYWLNTLNVRVDPFALFIKTVNFIG